MAETRERAERWYEFVQIETFRRPVYVKARSVAEARCGLTDAVSDYAPSHPDLDFDRRGKVAADQDYVQALADEGR